MDYDEQTKSTRLARVKERIAAYRNECIEKKVDDNQFWFVAKNKFPMLVDEIQQIKKEFDKDCDVRQFVLNTNIFENKSKELIRRVAVQVRVLHTVRAKKNPEKI